MATRKLLTLKDVRRDPKLLARFIKEHSFEADAARFDKTLGAIVDAGRRHNLPAINEREQSWIEAVNGYTGRNQPSGLWRMA